jgi:hypothetical protein
MKRSIVFLAAALASAACESPPVQTAKAGPDATGEHFTAPARGAAAVYFHSTTSAVAFPILDGRQRLATLRSLMWARADLAAGRQDLGCVVQDRPAFVRSTPTRPDRPPGWGPTTSKPVELQAGQTRFFKVGYRLMWSDEIFCTMVEVSAADGRAAVRARRQAPDPRAAVEQLAGIR